ncbi:Copine [Phytophthora cactorum]|nr:Copine [Phytophthora cactorum]
MGCTSSREAFQPIPDSYNSVAGNVFNCNLICHVADVFLQVDFTESNLRKGAQTFEGRSLHFVDKTGRVTNPYQTVISAITRVFELFDDDDSIPAFGFGGHPERPLEERYFPFVEGQGCELDEVLQRYFAIASTMELNASASFVPVLHEAIKMVKKTRRYHILIIISNGHIDDPAMARRAIVEASEYPICTWLKRLCIVYFSIVMVTNSCNVVCSLAIVMVGVGDGPWTIMREFDDQLPERRFDNFQFVNYNTIPRGNLNNPDGGFAMQALMEIPEQYNQIRDLGLIKN